MKKFVKKCKNSANLIQIFPKKYFFDEKAQTYQTRIPYGRLSFLVEVENLLSAKSKTAGKVVNIATHNNKAVLSLIFHTLVAFTIARSDTV